MNTISTQTIIDQIKAQLPTNPKTWSMLGFINYDEDIWAFGSDSKIIGRLFEIVVTPYLQKVAKSLDCTLHESEQQTVYPDFWLEKPDGRLIAIDIKSTYRHFNKSGNQSAFNFTLGAYSSFLRDGSKNISAPYSQFDGHIVIGFLYTRNSKATIGISNLKKLSSLEPAYKDVEIFVQEKYKIGGQKKGSGNTNNIGTIKSLTMDAFSNGQSYFTDLGNDVFEDYWRHYPLYKDDNAKKNSLYTDLPSYFDWLSRIGRKKDSDNYKSIYENWLQNPHNKSIR